jgi:hypothetical protein
VGTGYTVDEVKALNAKLGPVAVPFGKAGKASGGHAWPRWLHPWNMKADDVPDVWVPPHESVVVEVKCAELVESDQFSALKTPRFPRCENLRYDKVCPSVCAVLLKTTRDLWACAAVSITELRCFPLFLLHGTPFLAFLRPSVFTPQGWHEALTLKDLDELVRHMRSSSAVAPADAAAGRSLSHAQLRRRRGRTGRADRAAAAVMKGVVSRADALRDCPHREPVSDVFEGYSFSVEGLPEASQVKVPTPPGVLLPWSRKAAGPPTAHAAAAEALPAPWAHLSEAEVASMKAERQTPVSLDDVQRLLYRHGADKVVGSSLTHVDFVVTLGGEPSKKVSRGRRHEAKLVDGERHTFPPPP